MKLEFFRAKLPARQVNKFSGASHDYSMATAKSGGVGTRSNYFYCAQASAEEKRRPALHNAFLGRREEKEAQQAEIRTHTYPRMIN
jgi:hypothetical protein